ncbi:hypothetical protein N1851_007026 [Merluccius polli]|uniref:Uncharacterized protein n=1 Tax=Merluccius polli TaxID=89951 RepID=A0AA47N3E5_MERPO|nr:hypothetical protein N1851_007026 [Merluccius polli]
MDTLPIEFLTSPVCVRSMTSGTNTGTCHLQKFSDDSAFVGCVSGGQAIKCRRLVDSSVEWCEQNHLLLNISKTKEMVVDFRWTRVPLSPVSIQVEDVEVIQSYKYLFLGAYSEEALNLSMSQSCSTEVDS